MVAFGAEVVAVVPARGGSKTIPRKNIRPFAGHPLLAYSVAAGLLAESVGRVIVSTDDAEVAEVARRYGAEVPFLRPPELGQDDTPDLPVFEHALRWLADNEGYRPQIVVQLRPTSPLRPPDCVDRAVEILLAHPEASSVRGVVSADQTPYKMWRIEDGRLVQLLDDVPGEAYNMPRQKLPRVYWQTGHIDAIRAETILERRSMSGKVILPLQLDVEYSVDLNNESEWVQAEALLRHLGSKIVLPGRSIPDRVDLVVLDFDGVLTDDRVWVNAEGVEWVAAHRGDGWGLGRLLERGVKVVVLSTETNPVVAARCRKLGLPFEQGATDKGAALKAMMEARGVDPERTVYLGNDVNDLPCFPLVGCAVAVADAHPEVMAKADLILSRPGGHGAVRELCDMLLESAVERGIDDEELSNRSTPDRRRSSDVHRGRGRD